MNSSLRSSRLADIESRATGLTRELQTLNRRRPGSRGVGVVHAPGLTGREHEVLELMGEGLSAKAIASRLNLRVNTVRTYSEMLLAKLGAHSRLEAVVIGLRTGLLALGDGDTCVHPPAPAASTSTSVGVRSPSSGIVGRRSSEGSTLVVLDPRAGRVANEGDVDDVAEAEVGAKAVGQEPTEPIDVGCGQWLAIGEALMVLERARSRYRQDR